MDIENSQTCVENLQEHGEEVIEMQNVDTDTEAHLTYLVRVEQDDGTPQIVELTRAQANALGILSYEIATEDIPENTVVTLPDENDLQSAPDILKLKKRNRRSKKTISSKKIKRDTTAKSNGVVKKMDMSYASEKLADIPQETKMLHTIRSLSEAYQPQISDSFQSESVNSNKEDADADASVIFRVVYPDELDLKPLRHKKGRPKKKVQPQSKQPSDIQPLSKPSEPVKNVRTRSGRITRPPLHIKKDFKKIDTSESSNNEVDLKTVEFEPLKTNRKPSAKDVPIEVDQLENHPRKRFIAAQYRCPKCKKAYLGHTKMLRHLEQHPDHGPVPEHCKIPHDETWNFLIDLSKKYPIGQKGIKFCKELATFLYNVRILAKIFFKRPHSLDRNLYFVDDNFSSLLGIESGYYVLNENELHNEVDIFKFIKEKCFTGVGNVETDTNTTHNENYSTKLQNSNHTFDLFTSECELHNAELKEISHFKSNTVEGVNFKEKTRCYLSNNYNSNGNRLNFENNDPCSNLNSTLDVMNFNDLQINNHNEFDLNCDNDNTSSKIQSLTLDQEICKLKEQIMNELNSEVMTENCRKISLDNCNGTISDNHQNNILKPLNSDLTLHNELILETSLLNLPNLRASVDELILPNVDTQVNLLDNSTSSDEVMNVDQFVNERFKNITELELELPNTSLNLDLPTLDLFEFHTS